MSNDVFIVDAIRTPRGKGKSGGALHEVKPVTLVTQLLEAIRSRNDLDTRSVDDLVLGCVTPIGEQGAVLARAALLASSWDEGVAGVHVNRFCASGLEAVNVAAMKIASGWGEIVVAGGVESMSRVAMGSDGGAWMEDPATQFAANYVPQGVSADLMATLDGFTREDVDSYALRSQRRAADASSNGWFSRSLVPVLDSNGLTILDHDEFIRPSTTLQSLAALKPVFSQWGKAGFDDVAMLRYPEVESITHVHTAGNSSGIVDGAALVLLASSGQVRRASLQVRGRIVSGAVVGSEPTLMLDGPIAATKKALAKAGLRIEDMDLIELNEAFAAVVLRFQKHFGVPDDRLNVCGGAIALGHPLGATGAMLVSTCLDELHRTGKRYGLITLCVGAGMGIATVIEKV